MSVSIDRLARSILRKIPSPDRQLGFLADFLADGEIFNFPVPLGFIVGGFRVRGNLASSIEWANNVDRSLVSIIDSATFLVNGETPSEEGADSRVMSTFREGFEGQFEGLAKDALEFRSRTQKRIQELAGDDESVRLEDVPEDFLNDYIDHVAPREIIILSNAEIWSSESGWMSMGMMRLKIRSVSAWWFEVALESNEEIAVQG
jgi:hypothetical protein